MRTNGRTDMRTDNTTKQRVAFRNFANAPKKESNLVLKTHKQLMVLRINLLKPAGHLMHQQFNIQQLYTPPTLYLCVLYLSENKQRLVPLIS